MRPHVDLARAGLEDFTPYQGDDAGMHEGKASPTLPLVNLKV
jgi:hypothetical protein